MVDTPALHRAASAKHPARPASTGVESAAAASRRATAALAARTRRARRHVGGPGYCGDLAVLAGVRRDPT
jgi:hypothetical protein